MKKKKKLFLIVVPLLFLICFSSTASALSTEEGIGVDSPGLYTYVERFADLSGALTVTTTGVNNSGSDYMYITVVVICMDAERNFRLRIFDSDEDMFLEIDNENGIGAKERRWTVRPHMDKEYLIWTASVTDLSGEVIYAQLSLLYTYDDTSYWRPPGEEGEQGNITPKDLQREILYTILCNLGVTILTIVLTGLYVIQREGKGIKHFFRSKFKGEKA